VKQLKYWLRTRVSTVLHSVKWTTSLFTDNVLRLLWRLKIIVGKIYDTRNCTQINLLYLSQLLVDLRSGPPRGAHKNYVENVYSIVPTYYISRGTILLTSCQLIPTPINLLTVTFYFWQMGGRGPKNCLVFSTFNSLGGPAWGRQTLLCYVFMDRHWTDSVFVWTRHCIRSVNEIWQQYLESCGY